MTLLQQNFRQRLRELDGLSLSIFARYVLGLNKQDEVVEEIERDYGELVHDKGPLSSAVSVSQNSPSAMRRPLCAALQTPYSKTTSAIIM